MVKEFIFVFYLTLVFFSVSALGQTKINPPEISDNCELNKSEIESIVRLYKESFSPDNKKPQYSYDMPIIVIAKLGSKEQSNNYNLRRLKVIKDYFFKYGVEDVIITAQGERVKNGKGRVEIYYGGLLQLVIVAKHNKNFQTDCWTR